MTANSEAKLSQFILIVERPVYDLDQWGESQYQRSDCSVSYWLTEQELLDKWAAAIAGQVCEEENDLLTIKVLWRGIELLKHKRLPVMSMGEEFICATSHDGYAVYDWDAVVEYATGLKKRVEPLIQQIYDARRAAEREVSRKLQEEHIAKRKAYLQASIEHNQRDLDRLNQVVKRCQLCGVADCQGGCYGG